jgi:KDO2-lipid IV(A) lauroyltransferase
MAASPGPSPPYSFRMLSALFRLIALLPLAWLQAGGALLGMLVYAASAGYRGKLRANLARAGYPPALRGPAARAAGAMVGELAWIWFRGPDELDRLVRCDDLAPLADAHALGRGVLVLTPHLGGFEVTAPWVANRWPSTIIYRPSRRPALERLLREARNRPGLAAAPATLAGVRTLLRALRRGEMVGLLPDQVPGEGEGLWAPFLGAPAYTMTLPMRLAQASGAAVVLLWAERLGYGQGWALRLERFEGEPTPQALNAAMERLVRQLPRQYLWGYNRYKRPPGASAPPMPGREAAA